MIQKILTYVAYIVWLLCCALFMYITPVGGLSLACIYALYFVYEKYFSQTVNDIIEVIMTRPNLIIDYYNQKQIYHEKK